MIRTALRGLLAMLLLVTAAVPAFAAGEGVTVKAQAGFEGRAKVGRWVPVTLTLQNEGSEFEGAVQFESRTSMGPVQNTALYRTPVVIPAGGTKRVQVYVSADGTGMPVMSVVGKHGAQVASVQPDVQINLDPLVGVLGVEPADLPALAGRDLGSGRTLRLLKLDPATLPAEPLALENLDAILLDRFAYDQLPEPQRKALQAWVEQGGTLIAAAGPEAKRLEGLSPWLPLGLQGTDSVKVEGVGQATLARADLSQGWTVSQKAGSLPVVASLAKGAGKVYFLAFDPALEPYASWKGLPGLIQGLLPQVEMNLAQPVNLKANMQLADALNQFPMQEIPSTKGLLILLGIYAVLIGPVHFLLLRGFRRTGWALLTLPVLVAAGAGGAWAYTARARASDLMVSTVAVMQALPDGHSVKVREMAGLLMPPGSQHTVSLGGALLVPAPMSLQPVQTPGNGSVKGMTFVEGRTADLERREEWALRPLGAEAVTTFSGGLSGALTITDQRATGRLTNHLPFKLSDAVVVTGTSFQRIGDIGKGDSADVAVTLPAFAQEFGGPNPLIETIARSYQMNGGWAGGTPTQAQWEQMRHQQLVWAAGQALTFGQTGEPPMALLVGWTDYQALPVTVDGKLVKAYGMSMYAQPLPVAFGQGDVLVPASFVRPKVVAWNSAGPMQAMQPGWTLAKGETATVDFTAPAELLGRLASAEVRVPALGRGPSGKYPLAIALFRWTDSTWHSVTLTNDTGSVPLDSGYLRADGTVRVRMEQMTEERVPLGTPGLSVRAKAVRP